jgi:hypothetical protein
MELLAKESALDLAGVLRCRSCHHLELVDLVLLVPVEQVVEVKALQPVVRRKMPGQAVDVHYHYRFCLRSVVVGFDLVESAVLLVDLRAKQLVAQTKMTGFELVLVAHCHYHSCLPLEPVEEGLAWLMEKSGMIMERVEVEVEVASVLALVLLEVGLIAEAGLSSIDWAVVDLALADQVAVFRVVDQVVDPAVAVDRVFEADLAVEVDLVALVHLVRLHLEELDRQL